MKILGIIVLFLFATYCALLIFTNVWLTMTPLHPDKMKAAQITILVATICFVLSLVVAAWLLIKQLRSRSPRRDSEDE